MTKLRGSWEKSDENFTEHYINFLISHDIPKSMTLEQIKEATKSNKVLNKVTQSLDTGKWDTNDLTIKSVSQMCRPINCKCFARHPTEK